MADARIAKNSFSGKQEETAAAVAELARKLCDVQFDADPVNASLLGIPGRDHLLSDLSEAAQMSIRAQLADIAAGARALDLADLTAEDRRTVAVVAQEAAAHIDRIDARPAEYTISDLFFAPAAELLTMLPTVPLPDAARAEAYLSRLAAVPAFLAQAAQRHRMGVAAGRVPVARLVGAAIRQLDRYLADPACDPFRSPDPAAAGPGYGHARDRLLDTAVRPAFARYRDVLASEILPRGRPAERPGLCWLPGGETAYGALARGHTTTGQTPEELHRIGLELMADLAAEYADIGSRVFGTVDVQAILAQLRDNPALRCADGAQMLEVAVATIRRAEDAVPRWFGRSPGQRCAVAAVPDAAGPGGPAAYYVPPSLDGANAGTYYANTSQARERARYGIEALAFHEAVPGHHLQLAIAQELTHLPMLRRIGIVTAYTEGWAVYAERLADEMELYSGDIDRLGMVSADSRRTARLVVDTGLHAFGWTTDRAVSYLRHNTSRPMVEIESDVGRFIAAPGQALAYTIGRLEIQRIRADAEQTLGRSFDIRAFHDTVLGSGALPLAVLADVVAEWAAGILDH